MLFRLAVPFLIILLVSPQLIVINAQSAEKDATFTKIKLMVESKGKFKEKSAKVTFLKDEFVITSKGLDQKTFRYDEIVTAEYSYSKSPRWKTGLGLGAAGLLFPPLLLIALPLGFTKHRRHWFTVRTKTHFAVLRLSKSNRKHFIPTFETRTGQTVAAVGEDK